MNKFGTAVKELPATAIEAKTESHPDIKTPDPLAAIHKGKRTRPRRTLIYGVHGIGKSTLANSAPSPIFLPTEEGLNDIDCASFPLSRSFAEFENHLKSLANGDHPYQTIVVDSLDWLERLVWSEVCTEKGVGNIEEVGKGFGKGYAAAIDWWQRLIKAFTFLRNQKEMAIVLLAHSKTEKIENPEGENYNRYALSLHRLTSALLQEWCDEVLFANYKVYTQTTKEDFGKKNTKAIGGDERILRTQEKPFCQAKSRLDLPTEIPLTMPFDWSVIDGSSK